jgi:hypothetical protein
MKVLLALVFSSIVTVGLSQANPGGSVTIPTGVGGRQPEYGTYNQEEVAALRVALTHVRFPTAEGTIRKLVAKSLKPLPVQFVDYYRDRENKGRIGGNAVEYWLNHDTLLRVATAYYSVDGKHFNFEEWAVILTRAERESFTR